MSEDTPTDFIRQRIARELGPGGVATRFPPEPNGFLHIGHAKSIFLNFGIAQEFPGATCNLRFDDTNPEKESQAYIDAIEADVHWLGFDWQGRRFFTSDYFETIYRCAEDLIRAGKAYVDHLSAEEIRQYRGTLTEAGRPSPYRDRLPEENLDLFARMRAGAFEEGACVLRARIDMASPNINLRDPTLYRVRKASHHQTGDRWVIYPMYDFSHPIADALEGITHSLCTLEFEDHRPLYDWVIDNLTLPARPQQIEFARLSLEYTVMSKRKLNALVSGGHVDGWDDPRMPTLAGMRRRGYPASAIRDFCRRIGISKADNRVEMALLEQCVREALDPVAPRVMAVLDPLKVVLTDFAPGDCEMLDAANHPKDDTLGQRAIPLTREIYIDRADFMEEASKKYKRLVSGGEVRLRHAYVIRCQEVIKDPASGEIVQLNCTHDRATLGANPQGRKVQGVIHWVSAERNLPIEARLYDRLFTTPVPGSGGEDFLAHLNQDALVPRQAFAEESLAGSTPGVPVQFEREGFFCRDPQERADGRPVFNRTVTLRDTWAKMAGGAL